MSRSFPLPFAGESSVIGKIKATALRMFEASKLNDILNLVEVKIDMSSNLLLHLTMMLGNELKMQENYDAVLSEFENQLAAV